MNQADIFKAIIKERSRFYARLMFLKEVFYYAPQLWWWMIKKLWKHSPKHMEGKHWIEKGSFEHITMTQIEIEELVLNITGQGITEPVMGEAADVAIFAMFAAFSSKN